MNAVDFQYDGQYLSDYGFMICEFDGSNGVDNVATSANITFDKVPMFNGRKQSLVNAKFDECISFEFDICKDPDYHDDLYLTSDEYRDLARWLNRNQFLQLCIFDNEEDYEPCYFNASFNIEKIKIGERVCGMRLYVETDSPYAHGKEITIVRDFVEGDMTEIISDLSDDIGFIYPSLKITCKASGNLVLTNETYGVATEIKGCKANEVITINGETLIVESDDSSHDIYDSFNYEFFVIGNTLNDRKNTLSVSIPCTVEIKYKPIIKDLP